MTVVRMALAPSKPVGWTLGRIGSCISAGVIACGVSLAFALFGGIVMSVVLPASCPEIVSNSIIIVMTAVVAFFGVIAGAFRLWPCDRRVGAVVLLIMGLSFFYWLLTVMEALKPQNGLLPVAAGGVAAVLIIRRKRTVEVLNPESPMRSVETSPLMAKTDSDTAGDACN